MLTTERKTYQDMSSNRQDDLSFHMRIPADKCFANNALLSLDGICDHFCFTESSRDRIKKALETALNGSIEQIYQKEAGLFDLQISIYKNKMLIMVEDYPVNSEGLSESIESNSEEVKNMLCSSVKDLTDGLFFTGKKGCISSYSMSFDVDYIEDK